MTYNAARHFDATPAPGGGVTLKLRHKFRDQPSSFLPKTGLVDEPGYEHTEPETGNSGKVRNRIYTFGPLAEGQSYEFEELEGGLVAVVLSSDPADYPGEGGTPTSSGTTDRRSQYLTSTLGGDARKLANMNAVNKRYFKR